MAVSPESHPHAFYKTFLLHRGLCWELKFSENKFRQSVACCLRSSEVTFCVSETGMQEVRSWRAWVQQPHGKHLCPAVLEHRGPGSTATRPACTATRVWPGEAELSGMCFLLPPNPLRAHRIRLIKLWFPCADARMSVVHLTESAERQKELSPALPEMYCRGVCKCDLTETEMIEFFNIRSVEQLIKSAITYIRNEIHE